MSETIADTGDRSDSIETVRLGPNIGAEIRNLNLSQPLTDGEFALVHQALLENEVLVMRDQDIATEDQLAFGRMFGDLLIHPFSPTLDGIPELIVLDNHRDNPPRLTDRWHSDETFREAPPMATILRSTITPRLGGDTMFASMTAAFEGLPDEMQRLVSSLEGIFDFKPFRTLFGDDPDSKKRLREIEDKYPIRTHPVVRVHPESGRKSIFVNPQFTIGIKGMKDSESTALLGMLFDLAKVPEYQFRLHWEPNTMVMWDNRCVLHYAIHDYYPQRRRMERVTIAGDRPFGVDAPYEGPYIGRAEIELSEQDTPPQDGDTPVRNFKR
jgi:taurine dioxygenase